jgi:RHS repeat-associated protein
LLIASFASSSLAAPGGVYTSAPPTPTYKNDAPATREAEHGVSPDGSATYGIPFAVPPGRGGAQPSVSLQYSSRGALRGGIAAGWTLPVPMISVDTSQGRFKKLEFEVGGRRLIPVAEPGAPGVEAYRLDGDTSYTRYERKYLEGEAGYWIARELDGSEHIYGRAQNSWDQRVEGSAGSSLYGAVGRWFLNSSTDARGNIVEYGYETVYGTARNGSAGTVAVDIVPTHIEYGRNVNVPTSQNHARVEFAWNEALTTCPDSAVPIGAQFTYRTGIRRYEGAKRLMFIRSLVRDGAAWTKRRELELQYWKEAENCSGSHAPLRLLHTVTTRAWGPTDPTNAPSVVLPPITFTYGDRQYSHPTTATSSGVYPLSAGKNPLNNDKPGGWPSTDRLVADLAGSGIVVPYDASVCETFPKMPWANGVSPGANAPPSFLSSWEGCSLTAQVTHRETPRVETGPNGNTTSWREGLPTNFYGYRFLDVNGDDKPDLLAALDYQKGRYRPTEDLAVAGDYPACSVLPTPPCEVNGERVACLFAPTAQKVFPLDNSFGSGAIPWQQPPQPQPATCPAGECPRYGQCTGTATECCDASFCQPYGGCELCPPSPMVSDLRKFAGGPGSGMEMVGTGGAPVSSTRLGHVPDLHCGRYVYRVYLNESTSASALAFSSTPQLMRSPVPIDSMEMTTDIGTAHTGNASGWRAIVDLDGDQRPDAVYQRPNWMLNATDDAPEPFRIWIGSASGTEAFQGAADGQGRIWSSPADVDGYRERLDAQVEAIEHYTTSTPGEARRFVAQLEAVGLHDINGDGLLDLVRREEGVPVVTRVFYNTGAGFESQGTILSASLPGMSRRLRWGGRPYKGAPAYDEYDLSVMSHRPADLDGDGLIDVIQVPQPGDNNVGHRNPIADLPGATTAHYSTGDRFISVDASVQFGAFRKAFAQITISEQQEYRTVSDFTDMNGDGLPDMVMPDDSPSCTPSPPPYPPNVLEYRNCARTSKLYQATQQPLRVLTHVNNGTGGYVAFSYTAMRDSTVVSRDAAHERTTPTWVVSSMTAGLTGGASATTTYQYKNPVQNYDRQGRFGSRGFETIVETGPAVASGKRRRSYTTYRYDLEPRGLVSRALIAEVDAAGTEALQSVTDSEYVDTPLFGGTVHAYQANNSIVSACATPVTGTSSQSIASCLAAAAVARNAQTWTPKGPPGAPVAYVVSQERRLPTRADSTQGVRYVDSEYELRYNATKHHLLVTERRSHDAQNAQLGRSRTVYDVVGNPVESHVFMNDTELAVTTSTFDALGNILTTTTPNQNLEWWPLESTIDYDTFRLYPTVVTNELGHQSESTFDIGSGVALETRGPAEIDGRLVEKTRIDGLGRTLERSRGVVKGTTSTVRSVFKATYVDSGIRSVTTQNLFEEQPAARWAQTRIVFDGLGRIIREEEPSAVGTRVITREYDGAGRLVQVTVPDPEGLGSRNYGIAYDGLGRVTRNTSPLDAPVTTSYSGLNTIIEHISTDATPSTRREVTTDGFGRIVRVVEGVAAPATTTYSYDPTDRIVEVTDADGVSTKLDHDQRGLRVGITRGLTIFRYAYDANGNRVSKEHPHPNEVFDAQRHVSSWAFDPLDRVVLSTPATLSLTAADMARFGNGGSTASTLYRYDEPNHGFGTGRLTTVETPSLGTTFSYTAEGNVTSEARTWALNPEGTPWAGSAVTTATYGPVGNVIDVLHADGKTTSHQLLDDRGRNAGVEVTGVGVNTFTNLKRNLAGYLYERRTAGTGAQQTWKFDAEGRVQSSQVRGTWCSPNCDTGTIAGETIEFDSLGGVRRAIESGRYLDQRFQYDDRGQLVTALGDYQATFAYSPAGKLLKANVNTAIPNAEVVNRKVSYNYNPRNTADTADPAAVRALVDSAGNEFASLFHDASGNVTSRQTKAGANHRFIYDGDGRLREAIDEVTQCFEIYYYDHSGDRVLTYRSACNAEPASVRHRFDGTELFHDLSKLKSTTVDVTDAATSVRVTRDQAGATVEYLFNGVLGNLLVTTDESGKGTARFGYGPYGEVLYSEGAKSASFDHRFNGKAHDATTGLRYYGFRYYDPLLLNWTQADPLYRTAPDAPLAEPLRASLYAFSLNNPNAYVDPDGLDGFWSRVASVWNTVNYYNPAQMSYRAIKRTYKAVTGQEPASKMMREQVGDMATVASALVPGGTAAKNGVGALLAGIGTGLQTGSLKAGLAAGLTTFIVGQRADALIRESGAGTAVARALDAAADASTTARSTRPATMQPKGGNGVVLRDGEGATAAEIAASADAGPSSGARASRAHRERLIAEDRAAGREHTCWRCGMPDDDPANMHVGHRNVSRSAGGNPVDENLALEGAACNLSAGNRGAPSPGMSCRERGSCGAPYGR